MELIGIAILFFLLGTTVNKEYSQPVVKKPQKSSNNILVELLLFILDIFIMFILPVILLILLSPVYAVIWIIDKFKKSNKKIAIVSCILGVFALCSLIYVVNFFADMYKENSKYISQEIPNYSKGISQQPVVTETTKPKVTPKVVKNTTKTYTNKPTKSKNITNPDEYLVYITKLLNSHYKTTDYTVSCTFVTNPAKKRVDMIYSDIAWSEKDGAWNCDSAFSLLNSFSIPAFTDKYGKQVPVVIKIKGKQISDIAFQYKPET